MNKPAKLLTYIIVVFVLAFQPLAVSPVRAAPVACQARYLVRSGDTIGSIMKKYKGLTAWDIISANNRYVQRPNYPIYVGWTMCIPRQTGNKRAVSSTVINQPAAETIILRSGNTYTIYAWGWALNSRWWIKVNNERKVGALVITTKNRVTKSVNLPTRPTRFCFKNQTTDAVLCFPAPK